MKTVKYYEARYYQDVDDPESMYDVLMDCDGNTISDPDINEVKAQVEDWAEEGEIDVAGISIVEVKVKIVETL